MEKIIPGKVKIIYNESFELPLVFPTDLKGITKIKRDRLIRMAGLESEEDPNFKEIVLENSGFKISFLDNPGRRSWIKDAGRGIYLVLICLYHPSIEKKFIVYIELKNFMEILPMIEVSDGDISGTFCLEEKTHISGTCGVSLLPEDPEIKKKKEFNLTIESTKGTTKWKPGYVYVFKNRSRILYLGEATLSKPYKNYSYFESCGGYPVVTSWGYSIEGYEINSKIFVPLDNFPDDTWEIQLNHLKGSGISNFLENWLDKIGTENTPKYRLGKYSKSKAAVEYEKFLEDDGIGENLGDLLSSILVARYFKIKAPKSIDSFIPDIKLSDVDDQTKSDIVADLVCGLQKLAMSKYIPKPSSPSDLIQSLDKYNPSYYTADWIRSYYYLLKNIGKEELKKLIETKFNEIIN